MSGQNELTRFGTLHIERYYGSLAGMLKRFDKAARKDAFTGHDRAAFEEWRKQERSCLSGLLGLDRLSRQDPLHSEITERVRLSDGILREKVLLETEEDVTMPLFLLIPPETPKGVFIALPGHLGGGRYSVAGCYEIPAVREQIELFHYDYGRRLARMGYVTVCPDCRGFGERRDAPLTGDGPEQFLNGSCKSLSNMALPLGLTVIGLCVFDGMVLIDYLEQRGGWPLDNLGCIGFSGGGMQTMYLAALDERIKRAVISGYFYGFRDSLLILNDNCPCNYVPGLWEHLDMGDILSLFAPKPVFIQSCENDHLNGPRGLSNVLEQLAVLQKSYALFDAEDQICHDIRPGEHCFHEEILKNL